MRWYLSTFPSGDLKAPLAECAFNYAGNGHSMCMNLLLQYIFFIFSFGPKQIFSSDLLSLADTDSGPLDLPNHGFVKSSAEYPL